MNKRINTYPVTFNELPLSDGRQTTGHILQILINRGSRRASTLHLQMITALRRRLPDDIQHVIPKTAKERYEIRVAGQTEKQIIDLLRNEGFEIGRA